MPDFDAVVIGGGINGLTTAAYLAKSGLSVGVFESRGQCGANCDTVELGMPGFLHNTHACWLVPAMSPVMADLDLEGFGLDLRGTDVAFAKTFASGRNLVSALDGALTGASIARVSEHDARVRETITAHLMEQGEDSLYLNRQRMYGPPSPAVNARFADYHDTLLRRLGLPISGDDLQLMSGLEILELLYESEEARTTPAALGEYTGQWPSMKTTAAQMLGLAGFSPMAVHTARGGSHALTHALVRCVAAHGGEVWTTSPVEEIVVRDGRATGIRLSPDALRPNEEITAGVVISNLTLAPTFLGLLDPAVIGEDWVARVRRFSCDEPQLFASYYALSGDVEFASAAYDPTVQRAWVGYLGGDTLDEMRRAFADLGAGIIPDDLGLGWFLPTRADPTQAPPGCHTAMVWVSVPPAPRRWRGAHLAGWDAWSDLSAPLAEAITSRMEEYAPGFSDLVVEQHTMSPRDMEMNNPAAPRGNMCGGSPIPEQMGENRPLPGVITRGVSRTFVPGLYLSNSIHPYSATHLACGYLAAGEVAEDLGCRDQAWWTSEPFDWYLMNMDRIPTNLGVGPEWLAGAPGGA